MQPQHIHPEEQEREQEWLHTRSNIHAKQEPRSACLNTYSSQKVGETV
jgi:hypothetical protein